MLKMSETKARGNDPETSHEAAETVNVSRDRKAVLFALYMESELTDDTIFAALEHQQSNKEHMPYGTAQSLRSSRAELMREGLVELVRYDDGTPVGETAYGRRCRLYRLTLKGTELARSLF